MNFEDKTSQNILISRSNFEFLNLMTMKVVRININIYLCLRNLEKIIRFSLKSRPSEYFHWPEMSQIKAEISLHTNLKLVFHKNVGWQEYQWIP